METIAQKHTIKSINPATNELLREFKVTGADLINKRLSQVNNAATRVAVSSSVVMSFPLYW